jgi:hypothetical protein
MPVKNFTPKEIFFSHPKYNGRKVLITGAKQFVLLTHKKEGLELISAYFLNSSQP